MVEYWNTLIPKPQKLVNKSEVDLNVGSSATRRLNTTFNESSPLEEGAAAASKDEGKPRLTTPVPVLATTRAARLLPIKVPVNFTETEVREVPLIEHRSRPDATLKPVLGIRHSTVPDEKKPTSNVVIFNKPPTVEGYVLPTDASPPTPALVADPPPPPVAISPEAEKGLQEVVHGDVKPLEENHPSTLAPQALTSPLKPTEAAGFWDNVLGVFGGNRVKRDVLAPKYNTKLNLVANQTFFGVYRCEKASTIFAHMDPFNDRNIYQQMFAWRFWGILFLFIHLLMVVYHIIMNVMHRVPTSQRFNRVFAFIGLMIWDLITLWVIYQLLMWDHKFVHFSPIYPSVPAEFYAFLILSFAMNVILLYELITPMTFFLSYDITPRHPRRGYVPAAQSENEYISGIIAQLESAPGVSNENVKSRPVIRAFENNMV